MSDPKTVARERHARWRKANPDRWRTMCRAASKRAREREPLKGLWAQMIQRCTNLKNSEFKNYGARGIRVCTRWLKSFAAFKADMGPRPPGTQIERKDNSGPYSPKNCAWVTSKVQNRNRRNNRVVDYEGVSRTISEWAEVKGLTHNVISKRLSLGWSLEESLNTPIKAPVREVTFRGETQSVKEWCEALELSYATTISRLRRGWTVEASFDPTLRKPFGHSSV